MENTIKKHTTKQSYIYIYAEIGLNIYSIRVNFFVDFILILFRYSHVVVIFWLKYLNIPKICSPWNYNVQYSFHGTNMSLGVDKYIFNGCHKFLPSSNSLEQNLLFPFFIGSNTFDMYFYRVFADLILIINKMNFLSWSVSN